jgi:sn-glycerol 3-phosphate transport system substrate-binding protein
MLRSAALVASFCAFSPANATTEIFWWHSMAGPLGDRVNAIATKFNASQTEFKVTPVYKGQYDESMTAAIAAYRAGNAPAILQVFEVGTATMMSAKGAIVPAARCCRCPSTVRRSPSTTTRMHSRRPDFLTSRL